MRNSEKQAEEYFAGIKEIHSLVSNTATGSLVETLDRIVDSFLAKARIKRLTEKELGKYDEALRILYNNI